MIRFELLHLIQPWQMQHELFTHSKSLAVFLSPYFTHLMSVAKKLASIKDIFQAHGV
jgi:hypothetical protein